MTKHEEIIVRRFFSLLNYPNFEKDKFEIKTTNINWDNVIFKGLILKGIYGREMYETWYKMDQLIKSGLDLNRIITHKLSISKFDEAFEVISSGQCGKIVMEW